MLIQDKLIKVSDNCWTLFEKAPHEIKTKIIILGVMKLLTANFGKSEVEEMINKLKGM